MFELAYPVAGSVRDGSFCTCARLPQNLPSGPTTTFIGPKKEAADEETAYSCGHKKKQLFLAENINMHEPQVAALLSFFAVLPRLVIEIDSCGWP